MLENTCIFIQVFNNTEKNSRGCEKIFIKTYNQNSGNIL